VQRVGHKDTQTIGQTDRHAERLRCRESDIRTHKQ
jgi:hypothetical protein